MSGDYYCIGAAVSANILDENNAFIGVSDPVDSTDYSNSATIVVSKGNLHARRRQRRPERSPERRRPELRGDHQRL